MALKTYKPTSPGQRGLVLVDKSHLSNERPIKSLTEGLTSSGGRNNKGRMTARRRGGGHKRLYRKIDFKRNKVDISATVERLEYDPNRSAFIALIKYDDGELSYIIAPQRLNVGDKVISSEKADIKPGNTMPMKKMPIEEYGYYTLLEPFIDSYYLLEKNQKARKIFALISSKYQEKLFYFSGLSENNKILYSELIYTDIERYRSLVETILPHESKEYYDDVLNEFNSYLDLFL